MLKAILGILAGSLLLTSTALADDDFWDFETAPVDIDTEEPVDEEISWVPSATGSHYFPGDVDSGEYIIIDEDNAMSPEYFYAQEYYRSGNYYDDTSMYGWENVYGPMWGVPADAVGLDNYVGYPEVWTNEEGEIIYYEQSYDDDTYVAQDDMSDHDINRMDPYDDHLLD